MALRFDLGNDREMQSLAHMQNMANYQGVGENIGEALSEGVKRFQSDVGGFGRLAKAWRQYKQEPVAEGVIPKTFKQWKNSKEGIAKKAELKADKTKKKYGEKAGLDTAYEKFIEGEKTKTTSTKIKSSILGGGALEGGETTFDSDYITPEGEAKEGAYQKWLETDEAKGLIGEYKKGRGFSGLTGGIKDKLATLKAGRQKGAPEESSTIQDIIKKQNAQKAKGPLESLLDETGYNQAMQGGGTPVTDSQRNEWNKDLYGNGSNNVLSTQNEPADPWAATKTSGVGGFLQRLLPGGATGWNDPKQEWLNKQFKTGPLQQHIQGQWANNPFQPPYTPLQEQRRGNDLNSPDPLGQGVNFNQLNAFQRQKSIFGYNDSDSLSGGWSNQYPSNTQDF